MTRKRVCRVQCTNVGRLLLEAHDRYQLNDKRPEPATCDRGRDSIMTLLALTVDGVASWWLGSGAVNATRWVEQACMTTGGWLPQCAHDAGKEHSMQLSLHSAGSCI